VAVFMQTRGRGLLDANGAHSISDPGQLCLLDTTRPYAYRQLGDNDHKVLLIDPSLLARPGAFRQLCQDSADLPPAAMAMVGRATAELVRALITTAARAGIAAIGAWNAPATSSPTSTPSWPPSPPSRTAAASPT
jgi:hypothetical protein